MPSKIRAINLHKSYSLNERYVQGLGAKILKMINKEGFAELELVFLDDKSIRKFNKRYKFEDRATDVLSFKIDRRDFGQKAFLGEIMISLDTALENSRLYGTGFADEVVLYMIHGILHLFGYDDGTSADSRRMARKQNRILSELCIRKDLSKVLTPR
jgi:probable rRNA maturation factor